MQHLFAPRKPDLGIPEPLVIFASNLHLQSDHLAGVDVRYAQERHKQCVKNPRFLKNPRRFPKLYFGNMFLWGKEVVDIIGNIAS